MPMALAPEPTGLGEEEISTVCTSWAWAWPAMHKTIRKSRIRYRSFNISSSTNVSVYSFPSSTEIDTPNINSLHHKNILSQRLRICIDRMYRITPIIVS
jgi:hypothetical protein